MLVESKIRELVNKINELELELDIPHEKTLEVYKVNKLIVLCSMKYF